MTTAPYTNSIVNLFTVDPDYISRVPLYKNGSASDRHVLRTNNAHGGKPGDIACLLIPGKVITTNLREPVEYFSKDGSLYRVRGVTITAYKTYFDRLSDMIAHTMGSTHTIYMPVGTGCAFITQGTESGGRNTRRGGMESDSDRETTAKPKRYANRSSKVKEKGNSSMKSAPYTQDAKSTDMFNFKFNPSLTFNQRGKWIICFISMCLLSSSAPIYDGTRPFPANGNPGENGFDFSQQHLSALHKVPQMDDLQGDDFVVMGVTVTDREMNGSLRVVELNVAFAIKVGRYLYEVTSS